MTSSNGNIFHVNGPLCGNSPVTGEFPSQRPVTRSFDVFWDLRLNKRLSKQSRSWWFETPSGPLWRHRNGQKMCVFKTKFHQMVELIIHQQWFRKCLSVEQFTDAIHRHQATVRTTLIARFMGPTWGPSGADRTQVGPMLAPWTLLSGQCWNIVDLTIRNKFQWNLHRNSCIFNLFEKLFVVWWPFCLGINVSMFDLTTNYKKNKPINTSLLCAFIVLVQKRKIMA